MNGQQFVMTSFLILRHCMIEPTTQLIKLHYFSPTHADSIEGLVICIIHETTDNDDLHHMISQEEGIFAFQTGVRQTDEISKHARDTFEGMNYIGEAHKIYASNTTSVPTEAQQQITDHGFYFSRKNQTRTQLSSWRRGKSL